MLNSTALQLPITKDCIRPWRNLASTAPIVSDTGDRYALPMAEYNYEAMSSIQDVLKNAQSATTQVGKPAAIFVTEAVRRTWIGLPIASPLLF